MKLPVICTSIIFCFSILHAHSQVEPCSANALKNELNSMGIYSAQQMESLLPKRYSDHRATRVTSAVDTIPVVVHIVDNTGSINSAITDNDVINLIHNLNLDLAKLNPDTINIPAPFLPMAGSVPFRFCLAQQTPDGHVSNGIVRVSSTHSAFQGNAAALLDIQDSSTGGSNRWPFNFAFNIYITNLTPGLGGFTLVQAQPIVISYTTIGGRTATHEIGHAFGLQHIWGTSSGGTCTDTDNISDTPNQWGSSSLTCPTFPAYDSCTTSGNGILFVDYMDYSTCRFMFTAGQAANMTNAFTFNYSDLLSSIACIPIVSFDAGPSVVSHQQLLCNPVSQQIEIKNFGYDTLFSLSLSYHYDQANSTQINWNGMLLPTDTTSISIPSANLTQGTHTLYISSTFPNGQQDLNVSNDSIAFTFNVTSGTVLPLSEPFNDSLFAASNGWIIINHDSDFTWSWSPLAGHSPPGALLMDNHLWPPIPFGHRDDLINNLDVYAGDSVTLTFYEAYTWSSNVPTESDTLEIAVSNNGGNSWNIVRKYTKDTLTTAPALNSGTFFAPNSSQWQLFTIDLTPYFSGTGCSSIRFTNASDFDKQLWLDDINISVVPTSTGDLSDQFIQIFPNPSADQFNITYLQNDPGRIEIYNAIGEQLFSQEIDPGSPSTIKTGNELQPGIYFAKIIFGEQQFVRRLVKVN